MNILYTINDAFAPQAAAGIASVCENNTQSEQIHFFILGDSLSEETVGNLVDLAGSYGRKLSVISIEGFMDDFGDFDTSGWNEIVLSRLVMAKFLPKDISRVIYLDGDTICIDSLEGLWTTDLGTNIIGAAIEATVDRKRLSEIGLADKPYYNAGVLLIDLDKWRSENIGDTLVTYCLENSEKLFANDQDAINIVLNSRIHAVSPAYNYCNSYVFYPYRFLKKLMQNVPYYSEEEFRRAIEKPAIIHFLGEERPWRIGNKHEYRDDYIRYLNKTCYAGKNFETGWEVYFGCWTIFNAVFKAFPAARYSIVNSLIPAFLAFRKHQRKR